MNDIAKTALILVALFALLAWGLSASDMSPEKKEELKKRLTAGVALALAFALAFSVAGVFSPGLALAGALTGLAVSGGATALAYALGDATGARPLKCGDPGTCGQMINGDLCLHLDCDIPEGSTSPEDSISEDGGFQTQVEPWPSSSVSEDSSGSFTTDDPVLKPMF